MAHHMVRRIAKEPTLSVLSFVPRDVGAPQTLKDNILGEGIHSSIIVNTRIFYKYTETLPLQLKFTAHIEFANLSYLSSWSSGGIGRAGAFKVSIVIIESRQSSQFSLEMKLHFTNNLALGKRMITLMKRTRKMVMPMQAQAVKMTTAVRILCLETQHC